MPPEWTPPPLKDAPTRQQLNNAKRFREDTIQDATVTLPAEVGNARPGDSTVLLPTDDNEVQMFLLGSPGEEISPPSFTGGL